MSTDPEEIAALLNTVAEADNALADLEGAFSRLNSARAAKVRLSRMGAPAMRDEIVRRGRAMGGGL